MSFTSARTFIDQTDYGRRIYSFALTGVANGTIATPFKNVIFAVGSRHTSGGSTAFLVVPNSNNGTVGSAMGSVYISGNASDAGYVEIVGY